MGIILHLSVLALRPLVDGFLQSCGLAAGEQAAEAVTRFFVDHFSDPSQRLPRTLQQASERAWRALEIALEGESFFSRLLSRAEDRAFREHVRLFLVAVPLPDLANQSHFRDQCAAELKQARQSGLLDDRSDVRQLAGQVGALARYGDPQQLIAAEQDLAIQVGDTLRAAGFTNLAHLLSQPTMGGTPVLLTAVRYFFRRAVEEDDGLFRGLTLCQLDRLLQGQVHGFDSLLRALSEHGKELIAILDGVRDIQQEMRRLRADQAGMHREVLRLLEQINLKDRPLRPQDSFSIRSEEETRRVKQLLAAFQQAPDTHRHWPALANGMGKVLVATGAFRDALSIFESVGQSVADPVARSEAHLNAYHAALECRDWGKALAELQETVRLTGQRFVPIPIDKYEPEAILGAGGFGVVFKCRHRHSGAQVAVKALRVDGLDRDAGTVMREASVLEQLKHQSIIRLRDCSYIENDPSRPYLVLDYFESRTLEEIVRQQGSLPVSECIDIGMQIAAALRAAHEQNILHRDVKPGNILVQRTDSGWEVKLIDFGLALRKQVVLHTVSNASLLSNTVMGISIAGTLDYAAPEQIGKAPGVAVGTYSDVYSFGRTLCFMMFGTAVPGPKHWKRLKCEPLSDLLSDCLADTPTERPGSFLDVLDKLQLAATPNWQNPKVTHGDAGHEVVADETARDDEKQQAANYIPALKAATASRPGSSSAQVASANVEQAHQVSSESPRPEKDPQILWRGIVAACSPLVILGGLIILFMCLGEMEVGDSSPYVLIPLLSISCGGVQAFIRDTEKGVCVAVVIDVVDSWLVFSIMRPSEFFMAATVPGVIFGLMAAGLGRLGMRIFSTAHPQKQC